MSKFLFDTQWGRGWSFLFFLFPSFSNSSFFPTLFIRFQCIFPALPRPEENISFESYPSHLKQIKPGTVFADFAFPKQAQMGQPSLQAKSFCPPHPKLWGSQTTQYSEGNDSWEWLRSNLQTPFFQ